MSSLRVEKGRNLPECGRYNSFVSYHSTTALLVKVRLKMCECVSPVIHTAGSLACNAVVLCATSVQSLLFFFSFLQFPVCYHLFLPNSFIMLLSSLFILLPLYFQIGQLSGKLSLHKFISTRSLMLNQIVGAAAAGWSGLARSANIALKQIQ